MRLAFQLAFAAPILAGVLSEHHAVSVVAMDRYVELDAWPVTRIKARLVSSDVARFQVASGRVTFTTQLDGLRYFMYHWFLTTAVASSMFLFGVCLVLAVMCE